MLASNISFNNSWIINLSEDTRRHGVESSMLKIQKGVVMSQEPSQKDKRDRQKKGGNKVFNLTEETVFILKRNRKL